MKISLILGSLGTTLLIVVGLIIYKNNSAILSDVQIDKGQLLAEISLTPFGDSDEVRNNLESSNAQSITISEETSFIAPSAISSDDDPSSAAEVPTSFSTPPASIAPVINTINSPPNPEVSTENLPLTIPPQPQPESVPEPSPAPAVTPEAPLISPTVSPVLEVPPPTPVSVSNVNHVVISEIQLTGQDFIELYNSTDQAVDLTGWRLRKKTKTGTEYSVRVLGYNKTIPPIPAHGYFLWENSDNGYAAGIGADDSSSATLAANNSVALLDANGNIIDSLAWGDSLINPFGEGEPIAIVLEGHQSFERKAWSGSCIPPENVGELLGNGCDTDNNRSDFIIRNQSNPQNTASVTEPK